MNAFMKTIFVLFLACGCLSLACSGGATKKEGAGTNGEPVAEEAAGNAAEEATEVAEEEGPAETEPKAMGADEVPAIEEQGEPEREIAPGQVVNDVHYIVGDIPITSFDIEEMKKDLAQMSPKAGQAACGKRRRRGRARQSCEKDAVDTLIVRAILDREARKESIIISDARIEHEIEKRRGVAQLGDEKKFRSEVKKQTGMPFEIWKKNLRYQLIRRQLIQIKLAVPAPSEDEVRKFYNKKKRGLGVEIRFREIILQPRDRSLEEERRISTLARQVWREVSANPSRFGYVARKLSENRSRRRFAGGLYDYMPIQEVAERDRLLAGALYGLRPGQVSQVFRNRRNQYIIVRLEGKRAVPYEKVANGIRQMLYIEKEQEVFNGWIEEVRKKITITRVR